MFEKYNLNWINSEKNMQIIPNRIWNGFFCKLPWEISAQSIVIGCRILRDLLLEILNCIRWEFSWGFSVDSWSIFWSKEPTEFRENSQQKSQWRLVLWPKEYFCISFEYRKTIKNKLDLFLTPKPYGLLFSANLTSEWGHWAEVQNVKNDSPDNASANYVSTGRK